MTSVHLCLCLGLSQIVIGACDLNELWKARMIQTGYLGSDVTIHHQGYGRYPGGGIMGSNSIIH